MKKLMLSTTLIPVCAISIFPTMTQAARCMSRARCASLLGETGCFAPLVSKAKMLNVPTGGMPP